jgi:hypothetical protein
LIVLAMPALVLRYEKRLLAEAERSRGGSIDPQMTSWVADARANEFAAEAIASRVTPADSAA